MTKFAVRYLKNMFYPLEVPENVEIHCGDMVLVRTEKGEEALKARCVNEAIAKIWENSKQKPDPFPVIRVLGERDKQTVEQIQKEEVDKMNHYGKIYTIMLIVTVVSTVPLFMWLGLWAFIPWGIIWMISMYFASKIEKIKKDNDVQTYKEIVAFSEGKLLDDIHKQQEIGKRSYQKMLLVIGSALITLCVCILIGLLMHMFFN